MNTNVKFGSVSNFDTKMSSTGSQQIEVKANKNYETIQVKTNDSQILIPITTSKNSTMTVDTSGSAGYIRYIIDNETGSYLVLQDRVLQLHSKSGNLLSAVNIPKELPEYSSLRNKYLYIDSSGNLSWTTGTSGSEYYSGAAISIGEDRKVNLVFDTNVFYINNDGALSIDTNKIQEKLSAGDNIAIENNVISATDTKYSAGNGIKIDEQDNNKISLDADIYNYNQLDNKPSINGVTLMGALLAKDLDLDKVTYMSYKEYRNIEVKEPKVYFVCKTVKDVEAENCWRIYLQNKLIGEWDVESGIITLPVLPCRFPFRFA